MLRFWNKTLAVGKYLCRKVLLSWWASPVWGIGRCCTALTIRVASWEACFITVSTILVATGQAGWSPRCCHMNLSPPHLLAFKLIYHRCALMHLSAFEWLNVLDWQAELINWFLLSNCSHTLMAFELTVTTWGKEKKKKKKAGDSVAGQLNENICSICSGGQKSEYAPCAPSLKDLLVLLFTRGGKISNTWHLMVSNSILFHSSAWVCQMLALLRVWYFIA